MTFFTQLYELYQKILFNKDSDMENYLDKYTKEQLFANVDEPNIDLENEQEEFQSEDDGDRKLYVDKTDKSTSDWLRMIKQKYINLQPDYQRDVVWNEKMMSKFIESLLLSIPIPTIFLAENDDDSLEVIDGQQRITSIFAFMRSELCEKEIENLPENLKRVKELKLKGLETLKQYNGKTYSELPELHNKFSNISIPVVIIKKDSSEDIKYDIFSRINSGSVKLNDQELLNVMYRGVLIDAINVVSQSELVDNTFGNRPVLKKRFGYNEILLRAVAMECFISKETWKLIEVPIKNKERLGGKESKRYNGRLKLAILDYLKEYRDDKKESKRVKCFLNDAIEKVNIVFEKNAFKRIYDSKSTSINKTVSELQLVVLSRFDKELVERNKEKIKASFKEFLDTRDSDLFTKATNNTSNVEKRYDWGKILSHILTEE